MSLAFVTQATTNASHFCCWCICTPNEATKAQLKNRSVQPNRPVLKLRETWAIFRGNEMHTLLPSQTKNQWDSHCGSDSQLSQMSQLQFPKKRILGWSRHHHQPHTHALRDSQTGFRMGKWSLSTSWHKMLSYLSAPSMHGEQFSELSHITPQLSQVHNWKSANARPFKHL